MVKALAHMCFVVKNLENSIAFYVGKMGMKPGFDFINDKGERFGIYVCVGGRSFIEMFQDANKPNDGPAKGYPYQHFALEVDDINTTVADLRKKGVEVTDPKMGGDNAWQAWLADPDGNRIELHCYTPEAKQVAALK